jgi:23S rRNA (adenine2503-C2)-methyltransferase
MGMGEPFLNYEAVIEAIKFINDPEGFGIGARKISISTVGITEGIERFSHEKLQVNLAISWHAVTDMKRQKLMPGTKKYSIKKLLISIDDYFKKTGRQVMIEYLLLANFNDSEEDAHALADLFFGREVIINLLRYNPTGVYRTSVDRQVKVFENILQDRSIKCSRRQSLGREIEAACGQLATRKK